TIMPGCPPARPQSLRRRRRSGWPPRTRSGFCRYRDGGDGAREPLPTSYGTGILKLIPMIIRKPTDIAYSEVTPRHLYLNRRRFLAATSAALGAVATPSLIAGGRLAPVVKSP